MRRSTVAAVLLGLTSLTASATSFPDGGWQPVSINASDGGTVYLGDPLGDGQNNGRDIVGDDLRPAFYISSSATHFFFRLRLSTDPSGPGGLGSYGWGILIDADGEVRDYDYVLMADGIDETIKYSRKTTKTLASDPSELADQLLSSTPTSYSGATQNVAISAVGAGTSGFGGNEDYFLDMAVPLSTFYGANPDGGAYLNFTPSTVLRFWVGISNSSRAITLDLGGTGASPGPGTLIGTVTTPQLLCQSDAACGGATSGQVCNNGTCGAGCRGTGGNGCPSGSSCTSTTSAIGSCIVAGAPVVTAPTNGSLSSNRTPVVSGTAPAGATVTVFIDGVQVGTTTASGAGTWTYTSASLADGPHTAAATSTVLGVTSGLSNVTTFTIDATPPTTPQVLTPVNGSVLNTATPTITGTTDPSTTVRIFIDGVQVGTTTSGLDGTFSFVVPSTLSASTHTASAVAIDAAANTSPSSNVNTFTIDVTAPAAPVVVAPAHGSSTNNPTPTYSGTAEPNSTVRVLLNGVLAVTTTADASGAWSVTQPTALSQGPYAVSATATDAAGNVSPASNTNGFIVDLTPPNAPLVLAPANGTVTNDNTPTVSGTADANTTVRVFIDGAQVGTAATTAGGAWTFDAPVSLLDGLHTAHATSVDTAGNVSGSSNTNSFTVDTAAPAAPVVLTPANGSRVGSATPVISGTAEANSTVRVYLDGALVGTVTASGAGTWSFTSPALAEGAHTVRATSTDAALNTSASSNTNTFTVDTTAPAAPVVSAPPDGSESSTPQPVFSGTAEPNSTVEVIVDGASVGTTTANGAGAWSFPAPVSLADGSHSVRATATDAVGNTSPSSNTNTFRIDTAAPAAPVVSAPADGATVTTRTPTVSGTAEPNSTVTVYLDGASIGTTTASSGGAWSLPVPVSLTDGSHAVRATATDAAGNVSPSSATNTFTLDATAPAAPVVTAPANGSLTSNNRPLISGTAEPLSTVTVFIDGASVGTAVASASGAWSFTPTALADGPHSVRATATDAASNASSQSNSVSFTIDTQAPAAPVVLVPASGSTTTDTTPTLSGTAELAGLTITVRIDGTVVGVAVSGANGAWALTSPALSLGAHGVTATATDAAGNVSATSASNDFTVLPLAPQAPVLTLPADGAISPTGSVTFAGVAEPGSTVTVRVDGAAVCTAVAAGDGVFTCSPAQPLPEGPHVATASAANGGGSSPESEPRHFSIDTTAPLTPFVISPAPDSLTSDTTPTVLGRGEPGSVVTVFVDGVRLGSTTVRPDGTWSVEAADALALGAHQVSARATDAAGNSSLPSNTNDFTIVAPSLTRPTLTAPAQDAVLSSGQPTFTGTAAPGATVTVLVDGHAVCSTVAAADGAWSCAPSSPLADGLHRAVAETSEGGTALSSNTVSFTRDALAPLAPVVTSPVEGSRTSDTTPQLEGTAEPLSLVRVFIDGIFLGSVFADVDGRWSLTSWSLSPGSHTVSATATDRAGNVSPSSTPNQFTIVSPSGAPVVLVPAPGAALRDTTPTISGTGTPGATIEVSVDGAVVCTAVATVSGAWTCAPATPLGEGPHVVTAAEQGSPTSSEPVGFFIDSTAPAAPVITSPAANSFASRTPTLAGTAEPGARVEVSVDGQPVCVTLADAEGRWSCVPPTPLADGSHTVTARARDVAGNDSPAATPVPFVVDLTPPAAPTLLAPLEGSSTTDTTPRFSGTAEPGSTVAVRVDGAVVCTAVADAQGDFGCEPMVALGRGSHVATATATDAAGNTSPSSNSRGFTVVAETPSSPAITAPAAGAILTDSTPTLSGTAVPGSTVTVRDATSGAVLCTATTSAQGAWSCEASGLPDGSHRVVATAEKDGATSPPSAETGFRIDTTPPRVAVDGTPATPVTSSTGTTFTWTPEPDTTYQCSVDGGPFQDCSAPVSLPGLTPGSHTITVRATDAAGNASETTTSWLVEDPETHAWSAVGGGFSCAALPSGALAPLALVLLVLRRRRGKA